MRGLPVKIRGIHYISHRAAALALGVHPQTVWQALKRGTEDRISLGRTGAPGAPCYMNGRRWPSQAAASRALQVRPATICRALAQGRTYVRPGQQARAA